VWVGGLALALGGIFLVRYSIAQGLLGPRVRVALAALFAGALIIAGEWARRTERLAQLPGLSSANIPAILTAAGTSVAYADIYGAYALYGFLSPGMAFILLGIVALATLVAALLHGPALAGFGLIGAYVTPLLISTARPDYWALYVYLAVVTGTAFVRGAVRCDGVSRARTIAATDRSDTLERIGGVYSNRDPCGPLLQDRRFCGLDPLLGHCAPPCRVVCLGD
jgi:uncharacterized membrane protein